MMTSKIEQVIDEIENYLAGCKSAPFSNTKITVDRGQIEELLEDLRQKTPDEIKKYQKIISNKEAIIAEAKSQAEAMIADAQAQNEKMVSEHEIIQRAYAEADEIIASANKQAQDIVDDAVAYSNEIRNGSVAYSDDMLNSMLIVMQHAMDGANEKFAEYIKSMESSYSIVENNLKELRGTQVEIEPEEAPKAVLAAPVVEKKVPEEPIEEAETFDEEESQEETEEEAKAPEIRPAKSLKMPKTRRQEPDDDYYDDDDDDDDDY